MIRYDGITINRKLRAISYGDKTRVFSQGRTFEKISFFILSGGASCEMAFARFDAEDEDGGPLSGPRIYQVKMRQWQTQFLDYLDLEVRSYVIAGVSFYEIVPKSHVSPRRFAYARQRGGEAIPWNKPKQKEMTA